MKAGFVKKNNSTPPYMHNLLKLCEEVGLMTELADKQLSFIEQLCSYYIKSRYTEELQRLSAALTKEKATSLYRETGELFAWLSQKI